jgi:hypothetical protein
MRVPTYKAQAKRSQAGGGQFLTASLSPSAMAAPGKAISEVGNLMAEIGIKKMQIQTQNQVDQAEAMMLQELSAIQEDALMSSDPVAAEQATKDKMNGLLRKYTNGLAVDGNGQALLSGRNAKARFLSVGQGLVSAQIIDFTKKNNVRIIEVDRGNLDTAIDKSVKIVSNTALSEDQRANEFADLFATGNGGKISDAKRAGTIDDKGYMTRVDTATEQIVRATALELFKGSDDATATALQILNGESGDLILNSALMQMDADDKQKVLKDLMSLAESIDTERREQRENIDAKADAANKQTYTEIINTDTEDEDALAGAIAKHKTLLENNWYTSTQRKAAEAVLGLNKKEKNDEPKVETTKEAARALGNAVLNNTLTSELIERYSDQLSIADYKQAYKNLEDENKEGFQAAKGLITAATRYNEFKDSGNALGDASDMMFQESLLELQEWMNTPKADGGGQGASYAQMVKKAREINKGNAEEFQGMMKDALISYLTDLQTNLSGFEALPIDVDSPAQAALTWAATQDVRDPLIQAMTRIIKSYRKIGIQ